MPIASSWVTWPRAGTLSPWSRRGHHGEVEARQVGRGTPRDVPSGRARPAPPGSAPRRRRSSSARDGSGRPGGWSGKDSARQPTAPSERAERAAERAPAERPPTTSGRADAQRRRRRAQAGVEGRRRGGDLATGHPPRLLEEHHGDALARAAPRPAPTRSRASTPPPAPWLSSRVAIGRWRAAHVQAALAVRRVDGADRRRHHEGTSSSGSGSTSSGPLLRTLPTTVETG